MSERPDPTEIHVPPDLPLVRTTRVFHAPPAKVYRAHVDPEIVVRWLGPVAYEMTLDVWDARTGGSYRYLHAAEGEAYWFRGCFHELRQDERIVQTFTYEGMPDGVSMDIITFEDLGEGRTRLVSLSVCDSVEARDGFVASGMEVGVRESYQRLDGVLAG